MSDYKQDIMQILKLAEVIKSQQAGTFIDYEIDKIIKICSKYKGDTNV